MHFLLELEGPRGIGAAAGPIVVDQYRWRISGGINDAVREIFSNSNAERVLRTPAHTILCIFAVLANELKKRLSMWVCLSIDVHWYVTEPFTRRVLGDAMPLPTALKPINELPMVDRTGYKSFSGGTSHVPTESSLCVSARVIFWSGGKNGKMENERPT